MSNHNDDLARARGNTVEAMLALLGVMKRFDFDARPEADAIHDAFDSLATAMRYLTEGKA